MFHRGNYVKDLNKLGRDLQQIIIVDNSPASYIFHPDNAVKYTPCNNQFHSEIEIPIIFWSK